MNLTTHDGQWILIKVDVVNAFNTGRRAAIVDAVRVLAPHLLPWVCASLQPNDLLLGESWLSCTEGTQQGAPLSPLLFALTIERAIQALAPAVNVWFLDDGTLFCSVPEGETTLLSILGNFSPLGAQLSLGVVAETTVWGPAIPDVPALESLPEGSALRQCRLIPYTVDSGVRVLGLPVHHLHHPQIAKDFLEGHRSEMEAILHKVALFPDPRIQHCLVRTCVDACKVAFVLRGSDAFMHPELLRRADGALRHCFTAILGGEPVGDADWAQICLPMRLGGCGVRSPSLLAAPARVAAMLNWQANSPPSLRPPAGGYGDSRWRTWLRLCESRWDRKRNPSKDG